MTRNKELQRAANKRYYEKNKEKHNTYCREYFRRKMKEDPEFRKIINERITASRHKRLLKKAVDEMLEKGKPIIE